MPFPIQARPRVGAALVPRPGANIVERELVTFLRGNLANFKVPQKIVVRDRCRVLRRENSSGRPIHCSRTRGRLHGRPSPNGDEIIDSIKNAAGIILGVSENRSWIELFFEGDLMHTKTVNLPAGSVFDIYVEEIPHKATVYEHPRTMIFFNGPCDVRIAREGNRIIVTGSARSQNPRRNLSSQNHTKIRAPRDATEPVSSLPILVV